MGHMTPDTANTPSAESEVKQDVEDDTATGEVDGPSMPPKYSSDSDIGDSNVTAFLHLKKTNFLRLKFCI